MVSVHVAMPCFNEEQLLAFTLQFYKKMLGKAQLTFTVYDNLSTDRSAEIAHENGARVVKFLAAGKDRLSEHALTHLKNVVIPKSRQAQKADYVIICDVDEHVYVSYDDLVRFKKRGVDIVECVGKQVVSASVDDAIQGTVHGTFDDVEFNKAACFSLKRVAAINYGHGAHAYNPRPVSQTYCLNILRNKVPLLHYRFLGEQFLIDRFSQRFQRTKHLRIHGLATHYTDDEEELRKLYRDALEKTKGCAQPRCTLRPGPRDLGSTA